MNNAYLVNELTRFFLGSVLVNSACAKDVWNSKNGEYENGIRLDTVSHSYTIRVFDNGAVQVSDDISARILFRGTVRTCKSYFNREIFPNISQALKKGELFA